MKTVDFTVEKRTSVGKSSVKRLKEKELTPGAIYGANVETIPVSVNTRELNKLLTKSPFGKNTLLNLTVVSSKESKSYTVIPYVIEKDHLKRTVAHWDFLLVDEKTPVKVNIPLSYTGVAPGIKLGGLLIKKLHKIKVSCLPQNIPQSISVNIGALNIGDSLRAKNIETDATVKIIQTPENILCYIEKLRAKDAVEETAAVAA